jgi:hypothetical protein
MWGLPMHVTHEYPGSGSGQAHRFRNVRGAHPHLHAGAGG